MKYIELTNSHLCAICDDDAYEMLNKYSWFAVYQKDGRPMCVQSSIDGKAVRMHQLVLATDADTVDHKNHNIFDNRFDNLRAATYSQNNANRRKQKGTSSIYKGVSRYGKIGKWVAEIKPNGKRIYLGAFDDEIKAAKAYNRAALKYFGEFAKLNEFGDPLTGVEKEGEGNG